MEKYENLGIIGEGSYGIVLKCRNKNNEQLVAVKKFLVKMDDEGVRKVATREIKILKNLKHDNLVNLLEVLRRKGYLYLIMEFVDHNLLDELQNHTTGLPKDKTREFIWQILRGLDFCHQKNIIHRDIKPENVLVSQNGVVKLCDFGFARPVCVNDTCTDYVSTRWYRAPELLVGDLHYGKEVDIWAVGCLFAEMQTGSALFPGESDIDQLFRIKKSMGDLIPKHREMVANNAIFNGVQYTVGIEQPLSENFLSWAKLELLFLQGCLNMDPALRYSALDLLQHNYFIWDDFPTKFLPIFYGKLKKEYSSSARQCVQQELVNLKSPASIKKNYSIKKNNLPNLRMQSTERVSIKIPSNNLHDINFPPFSSSVKKPLTSRHLSTGEKSENFNDKSKLSNSIMPPIYSAAASSGTPKKNVDKDKKIDNCKLLGTALPKPKPDVRSIHKMSAASKKSGLPRKDVNLVKS